MTVFALSLEGSEPWYTPAKQLLAESGCSIVSYNQDARGYALHGSWSIRVPRPTSALTFAVFAHEVGHHMKGHCQTPNAKQRYIEEQEAWLYVLETFHRFQLPDYDTAFLRATRSMGYAFGKRARRLRGEVTEERFPGVDPMFMHMLQLTLAAGAERRFYYQLAGL